MKVINFSRAATNELGLHSKCILLCQRVRLIKKKLLGKAGFRSTDLFKFIKIYYFLFSPLDVASSFVARFVYICDLSGRGSCPVGVAHCSFLIKSVTFQNSVRCVTSKITLSSGTDKKCLL